MIKIGQPCDSPLYHKLSESILRRQSFLDLPHRWRQVTMVIARDYAENSVKRHLVNVGSDSPVAEFVS